MSTVLVLTRSPVPRAAILTVLWPLPSLRPVGSNSAIPSGTRIVEEKEVRGLGTKLVATSYGSLRD